MQQRARVLEHHPRLQPFADQLRDQLPHPPIAPPKHRRVVVIADLGVLLHVLQVADQPRRAQILTTGGNQRLVHMQRDRASTIDPRERIAHTVTPEHRRPTTGADRLIDHALGAADVRQPIDVLR
jgi:hypothetical protein